MSIWIELRCSAGHDCLQGHGESGFGAAAADSHAALKDAYSNLLKRAEHAGWQRDSKQLAMRCPHCAQAFTAAEPADIAGIPFAKFIEAAKLCIAGQPPADWSGRDGLPTAVQFRNALPRFAALRALYDQAPAFRGGRGKARAVAVAESRWRMVLDRLRSGETMAAICTGIDGWPTRRQWFLKRSADAEYRAEAKAIRPVRPKRYAEELAARRKAREAAAAVLKAERLRRREKARADAEELRRQQAERTKRERERQTAERNERLRREREERRVEKERRRALRAQQRREVCAAEKLRQREEAAARRIRNRAVFARKATRFKAEPVELRFDRRLGAPDAEGCRRFHSSIPACVTIDGRKRMTAERATLYFAGISVPKGHVVERTCWNDNCFAADHLRPTPNHPLCKAPPSIPGETIDTAAGVVMRQFGIARADLNGTENRVYGSRHITFARQVFRYLLNVELGFPVTMAARATGCDRSTITYGNHLIEDKRDDSAFDRLMDDLANELRQRLAGKGEDEKPRMAGA